MNKSTYSIHSAKLIKRNLQNHFGVEFELDDDYHTINVEWSGGPSVKQVFKFLYRYVTAICPDNTFMFPYVLIKKGDQNVN